MSTPILFLIFNRPQCTRKVFEEIRKNRPKRLYISADGPRCGVSSDAENCRLARQIATEVDWDCTVKTFFREENIGCGRAVQSGISWFFEHEEAGIILEDDCLPDATFFEFCGEMLRKYADDERIMHISGHNPLQTPVKIGRRVMCIQSFRSCGAGLLGDGLGDVTTIRFRISNAVGTR